MKKKFILFSPWLHKSPGEVIQGWDQGVKAGLEVKCSNFEP